MSTFDRYARYYDLVYEGKDYAAEAEFVISVLARHGVASGSILELGCGTGKHALELAQRGFKIHGIDLSAEMVSRARARITEDFADKVEFANGDVRSVRVSEQFDAVASLFHVASYQTSNEDIAKMFATACVHLRSGGIFLFDCWYGPAVLTDRPAVRVKRLSDTSVAIVRTAEPVLYPNENTVDVNYSIHMVERRSRLAEEIRETHRMRYFFVPELRLLCEAAGFELVEAVEWMTNRPLDFTTWAATMVARKL